MMAPRNINDGSSRAPRLLIYGNQWGLSELPKLPRARAWTFEETLDHLQAESFDGLQADVAHADAIRSRGLRYCTSGRANSPSEIDAHIAAAAQAEADCTTMHVGWGDETDDHIERLACSVIEASEKYQLPAYIETHRATIFQDLYRTTQLVDRLPAVRFNGDFSHLYCGQELKYAPAGFASIRHRLEPVLQRVSFLHGRISDGEVMQSHVYDEAESFVKDFCWMWETAMRHWLSTAKPGDILPFAPELGPPSSRYAITYKDAAGQLVEISDRWQQSLLLKRLAEGCFAAAKT